MTGIKQYIGTKSYYKRTFAIMLPILLQNAITNFVSLLDNIMVGQLGTEQMSGVAIANQLLFVFNLFIFGGLSGAGIFTTQFCGKGDNEGVRSSVRMKTYIAAIGVVAFVLIFWTMGPDLIRAFLHEGTEALDLESTYENGISYLHMMMIETLPFAVTQIFASTLRECGETVTPMKASIAAVFVNLVGNYILIFGKFGAPALGVVGAAIATIIARFVECAILIIYSYKHTKRFPFFEKLFASFKIKKELAIDMIKKGTPLVLNEILWAAGMTMLNQCYSVRGLEVVSATNISSTVFNLFLCVTTSLGSTITIIIGHHLGAGKLEEAVKDYKKIMLLGVVLCAGVGIVLIVLAPLLAGIYNTTDTVKGIAIQFLRVCGVFLPVNAYTNACYFTLRSGGKTVITFIFDSAFTWICCVSMALVLTRCTSLPILTIYIIVSSLDILKGVIGFFMVRSRRWLVNLVENQ